MSKFIFEFNENVHGGYPSFSTSTDSSTVDDIVNFKRTSLEIDTDKGKEIYQAIEDKSVEILENFDIPEYAVINRKLFMHLMGYVSKEIKKLPNFSTAPDLETAAGTIRLIPVDNMEGFELVGDIDRKVYRE